MPLCKLGWCSFLSTSDGRIEKKHRARGYGCFYFASKTVFRTSAAFLKTGCKCESCEHMVCFPVLQKHIKSVLQVWAGRDFLNCNWGNWNLVHAMAFCSWTGFLSLNISKARFPTPLLFKKKHKISCLLLGNTNLTDESNSCTVMSFSKTSDLRKNHCEETRVLLNKWIAEFASSCFYLTLKLIKALPYFIINVSL